jgi:transposase
VWFCEEHGVKTVYFEDLKNYQPPAGRGNLSWRLSSNLWGKIIYTVRYMRESLGHTQYSVWTVNPKDTSQRCHVCGKKGIRVESRGSELEEKGGEYFYCQQSISCIHADVNAARNIARARTSSVVPERAKKDLHPALSKSQ